MKSYAIFPIVDMTRNDEHSKACVELISQMVVAALRRGGDHFYYAVDWLDPGSPPDSGMFHDDRAEAHVRQFPDEVSLLDRIRQSVDPFNRTSSTVRSISTCRAVTFGFDGQAFLCLRHEDEAPKTPDPSLIRIKDYDYLTQTDYFDGWVRGTEDSG